MTELNCTNKLLADYRSEALASKAPFIFEYSYLGLMEYETAIAIQLTLTNLAKQKNQVSVLGLHHPQVITLGYRADESAEINLNQNLTNVPVVRSTRGGLATIHSEGQLVIYPIMNLKIFKLGVRDYVLLLLTTTQDLLKTYDIASQIDLKGAGLFTEYGKISFCGIQVHNGISRHGISLNVRNDLQLFKLIRSCGIQDMKLDSVQNYQVYDTLEEIFEKWMILFQKNLTT